MSRRSVVRKTGWIQKLCSTTFPKITTHSRLNQETGRRSTLVAAGGLSQRYRADLLQEIPELDALLGSQDFSEIVPLLDRVCREPGKQLSFVQPKPHYQQFEDQEKQQSTPRHFAYVKIAEGCSNMCTFCNIPM